MKNRKLRIQATVYSGIALGVVWERKDASLFILIPFVGVLLWYETKEAKG